MRIPLWIQMERAAREYDFHMSIYSAMFPARGDSAPVPESWAKPIAQWFVDLESAAKSLESDAKFISFMEAHIATLPARMHVIDHDALAKVLEDGMAKAILATAESAFSKIQPLSAGLNFAPLADAVAKMDRKSPVAVALGSWQWEKVPVAIRERSQFSAKVADARLLQFIQDQTRASLAWEKDKVSASATASGGEALIDRSSFIAAARKIAIEEGINTTTPDKYGTVRDIRSAKRLGLIFDMQTNMATEYARWKVNNDTDVLDAFPAQRLVRIEEREQPRPSWFWPSRWAEAYYNVGGIGAAENDMVALKTSQIWTKLSRFGTPWPPFDYGSGMGLVDVDRYEAESLGLIGPSERLAPDQDPGFNSGFEMGVKDLNPDLVEYLTTSMGDAVKLVDGVLKWILK